MWVGAAKDPMQTLLKELFMLHQFKVESMWTVWSPTRVKRSSFKPSKAATWESFSALWASKCVESSQMARFQGLNILRSRVCKSVLCIALPLKQMLFFCPALIKRRGQRSQQQKANSSSVVQGHKSHQLIRSQQQVAPVQSGGLHSLL